MNNMNEITTIDLPAEEEYLANKTLMAETRKELRDFQNETKVFSYLLKNSDWMVTNKGSKLVIQVPLIEAAQKIARLLKEEQPF